jgi:hypothetical protein
MHFKNEECDSLMSMLGEFLWGKTNEPYFDCIISLE